MVTIRQIPTDTSLTASTNVISMQYPNTILNTKMTLPQLVGPIDVVSPEHSSGDRSHEFQTASSKNANIEFSKAEYARPTKAELAHCTTSSRSSKYAQSQKLSSLTSQKYRIFPQTNRPGQDPRDHTEQPSRHDFNTDTLKQTPTKPGRNESGEKNAHAEHDSPAKGCPQPELMPSSPVRTWYKRARSVETGKATQQQLGPPFGLAH